MIFSFVIVEKSFIGIFRVFLMGVVIILIINLYISLVFSVTLEILHFKVVVYLFISVFFLLRLFRNLRYKFFSYEKTKNFIETWLIDYYILDKFLFWNIFSVIQYFNLINRVKLFLIINWWVFILIIIFF